MMRKLYPEVWHTWIFVGMIAACLLLSLILPTPAKAATDVWLFYGAGPHFLSTGVDTIARWARHLRGVTSVHVSDYRDTQAAYDYLRSVPSDHRIVIGGYSCGSNASLVVAGSLTRRATVALMQPSLWCGRYPATANMALLQNTYSLATWGFGSYTPDGPASKIINIDRRNAHLQGDNDRDSQRDVLAAIALTSDGRRGWYQNRLHRTTTYRYTLRNTTWLEGRE